jgi:hypothetical protein
MIRPLVLWGTAAVAYALFCGWYTGCGGPLTADEIDRYMAKLEQHRGADPERIAAFREMLEADDGGHVVMVNAILMRDTPQRIGDVGPDETSTEVLDRYMAYMLPAMLARASHPIFFGLGGLVVERWGVEGAQHFSQAGLVRYRSLRDLMEIATDPAFDGAHVYKVAAMDKTLAFPVRPVLNPGDPRLLLGSLLVAATAVLHVAVGRR